MLKSFRLVFFVSTLFTASQVMAQDACVSGTVPVIGCLQSSDDGTFDLTGDITPNSGLSAIRFIGADRNTFNYTGNINTEATGSNGLYLNTSTFNNITINGNIDVGALGLYGILSGPSTGSNTIIMNGNITTNRYNGYGYFNLFENNTNFTLNGNITTIGDDAPGILIFNSDNANITLNGSINTGESRLLNGRGIDIQNSSGVTITNLGTITTAGDDPYDIYVRGTTTVATLNNRQSGLTYYGKIPTNYNAVINSTSDYGKIIFSTVSGTTSFGIYNGSVLERDTTYASVIDGLEDADITAETKSGNYTYNGRTWAWTLENSSADLWDLIVGTCTGCILEDTQDTIEEIQDDISTEFSQLSQLSDKATGSFANMNTYDCDLFDTEGKCYSMGGRHTDVNGQNNSDSSSSGAVFVTGYRFNDNFRVSAFIDQQVSRKDPEGISVRNKGPMVGANLVWNQFANHLGFQFRLANAYQAKDMTITRSGEGEAEAGRGETEIEVQNYVAEVSYQFSDGVKTSYRPYFAARRSIIKQDGYTETGIVNPLTYNTLEDKSTTIVMGIKAKYKLNNTITLNGAYGVEHDVNNHVDKIQATSSTITGITPVDLNATINKTRPVVTLGSTYYYTPTQTFSAQVQYQELSYTSTNARTAYFNYTVGF